MKFVYDDGGRKEAGFKGDTGDCFCRAVAIAAQLPYKEVYERINQIAKGERLGRKKKTRSHARTGVFKYTRKKLLQELGWEWTPTMQVGQGCKVHLRKDELPRGRLVVSLSKHSLAVVDGVAHDTYPDDIGGTRCVYGYWKKV